MAKITDLKVIRTRSTGTWLVVKFWPRMTPG